MSEAFGLVQSRLEPYGLRMHGDRGRAACPVCGGRNKSTLSIGTTREGAVLMKCFKEHCSTGQIAAALGLELGDLFPPRPESPGSGGGPVRRRRLLQPLQALDLLTLEVALVWTAAHNLANGHSLTPEDLVRLSTAAKRIRTIADEVRA